MNTSDNTSEVKKAAEQADVQEIEKNLQQSKNDKLADKPETLTDSQKTPFIDEKDRTDK